MNELCRKKTCLQGFQPGQKKTKYKNKAVHPQKMAEGLKSRI